MSDTFRLKLIQPQTMRLKIIQDPVLKCRVHPGVPGAAGAPGPPGAPGVIQSVVAGSNISVNNADPANPIVSSSAAGVTDGDKGDVVVTGGGTIWTVDPVTGTGNFVRSNSPTLVTPALGTPASGVVTNLTGTASININGTVGATTPAAGTFTAAIANSFVPNLSTVPSNGMYLPAANTLGWAINSAAELQLTATALSPAASDGSALGTASLQWSDVFLADNGVINWANSNARLIHSSAAGARRWEFTAATSEAQITVGYTGGHTFATVTTGYGVLNQLSATFNTGSDGSAWKQYYSQNLVNVQSSVVAGAVYCYEVQNGTQGSAPTGTITEQVAFLVDQPTGQHSGSAALTVTTNIGLRVDSQSAYSGGAGTITVSNSYGVKISDQGTGANNYAIHTGAGKVRFGDQALSVHATGGIGYGTGAGGTVTQATSKSTGVTLNKVCGQITMNGAALAAATTVTFTLTNSAIAATDFVGVNIGSAASAGAYTVTVDQVAAGSCRISLRNESGGSLSEALVLNFAVIKAVTS